MEETTRSERKEKILTKGILIKIVILFFGFGALFFIVHNSLIASQNIGKLEKISANPTTIYDQNNELASRIGSGHTESVNVKDVPQHFIDALVATEDQKFYEHNGIDYFGITRAAVNNVLAGGIVEGGSTLTQQLAKNSLLTQDQTYLRKFKEYFISQKIEREYSKEEILEMYLNNVYFGEGAWGLKKAAKVYFAKDVQGLSVNESAILVGLIKAPTHYSPIKHYEKSLERRNVVLSLMNKQGLLSKSDLVEIKKEKVTLEKEELDPYKGRYPSYVDYIMEEAIERYGLTQNEILTRGLKIYTSLDQDMQGAAETVFKRDELFPEGGAKQQVEGGGILMDPKTGGIRALVGGRGDHSFREFNHATQLSRQPGSTMKPLAAYTPALEKGFEMNTPLKDEPIDFNGYKPKNFDGSFHGTVSMYEAFINSYNIPAVWTLNEIGISAGIDAVERFDLPITENDRNLGLALGGFDKGIAPIDLAEAYTTFPNEGKKSEAHAIEKIVDKDGNVIGEWEGKQKEVTSKEVANKITYMMMGVVNEGTGKKAKLDGGWDLAAKTGSTQHPDPAVDGVKDQWVVGFTPNVVGALWLGYDQTDKEHYLNTSSGATAVPIYKEVMQAALEGKEPQRFYLPAMRKPLSSNAITYDNEEENWDYAKERQRDMKKERDKWLEKRKDKQKEKGKGKERED
ncbi:transglycosylase domain-containing protein [Metabacillus arenae]|nr:PBP1A family penicillin-binding protein [Metabacillus arenae]